MLFMMIIVKNHSTSLGSVVTGEQDNDRGLASFRGIPYASLSTRWTQSCVLDCLPSSFDALRFGPRCPQPNDSPLVSGGVNDSTPGDDEFKCLNLNITVPVEALQNGEDLEKPRLPVMVWVHGGSFKTGSNSIARYRPYNLCSLAKESGNPVIIVQINYRLGAFAFAASNDLTSEQSLKLPSVERKVSNFDGNFGLSDQHNALLWIQKHIHDFGGDASNVTAFGVSAGSASIHHHILDGDPLFDRAILMSGLAPLIGIRSLQSSQVAWDELCRKCDLSTKSSKGRVKVLRALPPEELMVKYSPVTLGLVAEERGSGNPLEIGNQLPESRCMAIIVGDSRVEGIIFDKKYGTIPQERFHQLVRSIFPRSLDVQHFYKYFGFSTDEQPSETFRDAMRFFFSVVIFQYPNLRFAEKKGCKTYLYHFEELSPYAGLTFGLPYHGQCALFIHNNDSVAHSDIARKMSQKMATLWSEFAHGKEPWQPYLSNKQFIRFGPNGSSSMRDLCSDETRDYGCLDWLSKHFDDAQKLIVALR